MKTRQSSLLCCALSLLLAVAGCNATPGSVAWEKSAAADPRAAFLKLIDRPRVALDAEIIWVQTIDGIAEYRFTYFTEKDQSVPGVLLKRVNLAAGRHPVVVGLHGTNGDKTEQLHVVLDLVKRGFIGVAIDGRYHGERAVDVPLEGDMTAYESAILRAWRNNAPEKLADKSIPHEHPFFYDTVWDIMRLIDYLQTRDDVDPKRIGLYGVSKGGIEAYTAIAVDPRIAAAVPCISVESFRWADDNNMWQHRIETIQKPFDIAAREAGASNTDARFVKSFYSRVVPGIEDAFDGPSLLPLAAPRPFMSITGELDPRTPAAALKLCADAARVAYKRHHAEDRFVLMVQPNTPHRVNPEAEQAAVEFLAKALKP